MDDNFCELLDNFMEKLDSSYSDCVQVQNVSGGLLHVAEGVYVRNYSFAIVSKNNKNLKKFVERKKVLIHNFSITKAPKKKKVIPEIVNEAIEAEEIAQSIDITNLTAIFNPKESNKNQDEI